ncbi:MAG: DUF11 domain-containing protein [Gemmatimonadota bacterium]
MTTNDSSAVNTTLSQSADLSVAKSGPATDTAGSNVTYTIGVQNSAGPSDASGVTVTDTLPASLTYVSSTGGTGGGTYDGTSRAVTWNVGTLAAGGSTSLGLTVTIDPAATGSVSNRAWVGSTTADPATTNDSSTVTTTLTQSADLSVTKTAPATDTAGTNLTYAIAVNHVGGPSDATGVTVTDTLPASLTYVSSTGGTAGGTYDGTSRAVTWSVGTLAAGSSTSLGLTVTIDPAATGSVSNRAWVGSTTTDPVTTNDSSTVATTLTQSADLSVTKTGQASVTAGSSTSYTIGVLNTAGPSDASGVTVTDTLPAALAFDSATGGTGGGTYDPTSRAVTWNVGPLAAGGNTSLLLYVTVDSAATGSVSNRAWVSSTTPDPVSANDSATATLTVAAAATPSSPDALADRTAGVTPTDNDMPAPASLRTDYDRKAHPQVFRVGEHGPR